MYTVFFVICLNGSCHQEVTVYNGDPSLCTQSSIEMMVKRIETLKVGEKIMKFGCKRGEDA